MVRWRENGLSHEGEIHVKNIKTILNPCKFRDASLQKSSRKWYTLTYMRLFRGL